jgi:hypothetical protein
MLPSGLPEQIRDEEDLARFLTSSSHLSAVMVKPAAFLPRPDNPETSVFRHGADPREDLWALAREHIGAARNLHGVAILIARDVRATGLDAVSSEPPPRHANITGWASHPDDPDLARARRKEQALSLAQQAKLIRR